MATVLQPETEIKSQPIPDATAGFEHIGDILRRLRLTRRHIEQRMSQHFDLDLSLALDAVLQAEDQLVERPYE